MSQLILCILIIFTVGHIHAESNESEENDSCEDQAVNRSRLESICMDNLLTTRELSNAFNSTVIQYLGDDDAVREQSDKYCPILNRALECTLIGYKSKQKCISLYRMAEQRQSYEIARTWLNYMCANRSEIILQVLQDRGLETIYDNEKSKKCLQIIEGLNLIDEETLGATLELCKGVDKTFACYSNMVRDHKNKNLIRIAGELNELHRQAINCPPANQLL